MNFKQTSGQNPTVNLAINKSRIKKYGKKKSIPTYYLDKGQEFQIELYNPNQDKVLATIKLNGKIMLGSLVLRPGERVFLDRYLDSNNKFLFDTYDVDDSESAKKAIQKNGDLEVSFFREISHPPYNNYNHSYAGKINLNYGTSNLDYGTLDNNLYTGNVTTNLTNISKTNVSTDSLSFLTCGSVGAGTTTPDAKLDVTRSIETGMIDKGSESDQDLIPTHGYFEMVSFHVVEYKLLPKSQKKATALDYYKKYCGNCGAKCKTKFCSQCGAKQ